MRRNVEFEIPGNRREFPKREIVKGVFHLFGNDINTMFDGKGYNVNPITVAIVEDENGNIHKINPENVKFLDK